LIGKGELLITIMSSLAQEESRIISENVTWGHRKRFTVNFLTKETKANEGEVPQYYVENNHEAIISPQVFDWVQEEIKRRRDERSRYSGVSIFSSKIKCGQCGSWYGAKVWHSTDKYRRTIYRCNDQFKSHCKTPHLTEDNIKEAFVRDANQRCRFLLFQYTMTAQICKEKGEPAYAHGGVQNPCYRSIVSDTDTFEIGAVDGEEGQSHRENV